MTQSYVTHSFTNQALDMNAAAISSVSSTLSLLGPFNYNQAHSRTGSFSFAGQADVPGGGGGRGVPTCFFFEEAPSTDEVRPYVANARTYVRTAAAGTCKGISLFQNTATHAKYCNTTQHTVTR